MTVLERVGSTPLLQLEGLFIKLERSNPGGSVKDRIARFMLEEAARRGELLPDDHIVEATSGNTGIALAFVGRQLGYRVLIFMPEHMSPERRRMMENLGAEVRLTPRAESFRGAIARRDAFRADAPATTSPISFANPDNVRCHALTTGHELGAAAPRSRASRPRLVRGRRGDRRHADGRARRCARTCRASRSRQSNPRNRRS